MVKNPPAVQELQEMWVQSLGLVGPLEEGMATHSVFLSGECYGHKSLVGFSPWGCKESDLTSFQFSRSVVSNSV